MPRKNEPIIDDENPEWTKEDFAKGRRPEEVLPPNILRQFKNYRGPQKTLKKVPISLRLSPEVVKYFKAKGPGWQTKIDTVLRKAAGVREEKPRKRA
jgi:uncharacterized protein (DUF4415 family)